MSAPIATHEIIIPRDLLDLAHDADEIEGALDEIGNLIEAAHDDGAPPTEALARLVAAQEQIGALIRELGRYCEPALSAGMPNRGILDVVGARR